MAGALGSGEAGARPGGGEGGGGEGDGVPVGAELGAGVPGEDDAEGADEEAEAAGEEGVAHGTIGRDFGDEIAAEDADGGAVGEGEEEAIVGYGLADRGEYACGVHQLVGGEGEDDDGDEAGEEGGEAAAEVAGRRAAC